METFSAGDAVLSSGGFHKGEKPMLCDLEHISSWDVDAGLDTTEAHDTSVKPLPDQRGSIFDTGNLPLLRRELILFDSKFIGPVLKLTLSAGITDWTIQGMVDQKKFESLKPHPLHTVGAGMDHHPIHHRRGTGGHGHIGSLHIDQTDPAGFDEAQLGMVAEGGNVDPIFFGHLKNRLIRPCRYSFTVDCQLYHSIHLKNPKSEYRNPKQILNPNFKIYHPMVIV